MSKEAYCLWFDKFIMDLSGHESESCMNPDVEFCDACDCFVFRDRAEWDEHGSYYFYGE